MKKNHSSFENLEVYQKLCELHIEISQLTSNFPDFEMHEIGSDLRRSSNSAPACIAEGYSNKHVKFYLEKLAHALGEIRQTKHYLNITFKKNYIKQALYIHLTSQYVECERLLKSLEKSVYSMKSRYNNFTKNQFPDAYYR